MKRELSAQSQFIERLGISAEEDGLPRIAGRMLAFFVIHGGPVSFGELADQLQVSRGSVSTNSRLLISLGVIQRVSRPGERQDYFELARNPYARMMAGYLERVRANQALAAETLAQTDTKDARKRLRDMQRFYDIAMRHFGALLDELNAAQDQA